MRSLIDSSARITLVLFAILTSCTNGVEVPEVPVPEFARDLNRVEYSVSQYHLEFYPEIPYSLDSVREFYGKWAEEAGWRLVDPEEESWSHDSWESFEEMNGRAVSQLLVHWVDPEENWSLRLALRSFGAHTEENVAYVIVAPFANLDHVEDEQYGS